MRERLRVLDPGLVLPLLGLLLMGTLTVYSAGRGTPNAGLWIKQLLWGLIGFVALAYLAGAQHRRIFHLALPAYGLGLVLLVAVLIVGKEIAGTRGWLRLGGLTLQPSELVKWLTLLMVAQRLGSRPLHTLTHLDLLQAGLLVLFPMLLVLAQPDTGVMLTYTPIFALLPLIRGIRFRWVALALLLGATGSGLAWRFYLKDYQKERILTFLDPERDPKGKGYQVRQSRIAVGAGGLTGQGFTRGTQTQLNLLPVKTTDFAFSAWAEERGFLGVFAAFALFGLLLRRILQIAGEARTAAGAYFAFGCACIFGFHILINTGMVVGALPTTGIPLPFFTYGGSSTLAFFLALGVVLNIRQHAKVR